MRPLTALEMLEVWERASTTGTTRRALALLRAACPEARAEELAALCVGERDARLLTLREWFFGSHLDVRTECPSCGERVQASFELDNVRTRAADGLTSRVVLEDHETAFRLPDSTDLAAIESCQDAASARRLLLERCVLTEAQNLNEQAVAEIVKRMNALDPQASIRLAMGCPACQNRWSALFDIATFFWQEIHVWARRMLREVHTLASAYGWSERDILSMSAARRSMYLDLVAS